MAHQLLFRHQRVVTHDNRQAINPQIPLIPSEFVRDVEISSGVTRWKSFFQESGEPFLSAAFVHSLLTFLTGKLNGKCYSAAFHTQIDRLCLAGHIKLQEFGTLVCCLSRPSITKRWCLFPVRATWAVQTWVYCIWRCIEHLGYVCNDFDGDVQLSNIKITNHWISFWILSCLVTHRCFNSISDFKLY